MLLFGQLADVTLIIAMNVLIVLFINKLAKYNQS